MVTTRPGWPSGSTRCSGRRPHEAPEPRVARVLPVAGCRRCADLQVPPVLLRVRDPRVPEARGRPRHREVSLATAALQPLESRRRGLPVILASPLTPLENALAWLL